MSTPRSVSVFICVSSSFQAGCDQTITFYPNLVRRNIKKAGGERRQISKVSGDIIGECNNDNMTCASVMLW
jgi:hypothetical protein